MTGKTYTLLGADGKPYASPVPGALGGNRSTRIFGRLDCPTALRHLAGGRYAQNRVFFADQPTAEAAGYRPCGSSLPELYRQWKEGRTAARA
jgi:methylphosphotriester-DNA--protein-cysteine methyltransferase